MILTYPVLSCPVPECLFFFCLEHFFPSDSLSLLPKKNVHTINLPWTIQSIRSGNRENRPAFSPEGHRFFIEEMPAKPQRFGITKITIVVL
ncbi:hypothetical protein BB560_002955 [Smittium megazygosporum]|uniref:Uncharacterized protein n=1 Tax=Smittium megazygosporum TaxID=133381 RepID=A0A2T9ZDC4_9FUNG|nr:hypothetical protein BB560_002955 [Smittium megazygosporum]